MGHGQGLGSNEEPIAIKLGKRKCWLKPSCHSKLCERIYMCTHVNAFYACSCMCVHIQA